MQEEEKDSESSIIRKLSQLFESSPLYKKLAIRFEENMPTLAMPGGLQNLTFVSICPTDGPQTYKLLAEPHQLISEVYEKHGKDDNIRVFFDFWDNKEGQIRYFQFYSAACQFCNKHKMQFLVHVYSSSNGNVYFSKVGQYPAFTIKPDPELYKWLNDEDKENYNKALICKSQNYGIGAYAYLRRIVEKEIVRMVEDLSLMDGEGGEGLKSLLLAYGTNRQMDKLISGTTEFMPSSFNGLGKNPIKFLHQNLSEGLHTLTDEECLERAEQVDIVLKFVIKKINEENSDLKAVRRALKGGKDKSKN